MPKQRPPFDIQRYKELKAQDLSQRHCRADGMPEATLRNNLKVLAQSVGAGISMGDQGLPGRENAEASHEGPPEGGLGTPALYIHQGMPDDVRKAWLAAKISKGSTAIPALPHRYGVAQGPTWSRAERGTGQCPDHRLARGRAHALLVASAGAICPGAPGKLSNG